MNKNIFTTEALGFLILLGKTKNPNESENWCWGFVYEKRKYVKTKALIFKELIFN